MATTTVAPAGISAWVSRLRRPTSALTEAELRTQLMAGKSLADVAKAKGKTVAGLEAALTADAKKKLDAAVKAGRLTQAQADEALKRMTEHLDDVVNGNAFEGQPSRPTRVGRASPGSRGAAGRVRPDHPRRLGCVEDHTRAFRGEARRLAPERRTQAFERAVAVLVLDRHGSLGVTGGDRVDQGAMCAVGFVRLAGEGVVQRAVGLGRVPQEIDQAGRRPARSECVEPVVEATVGSELARDVTPAGRGPAGVGVLLERCDIVARRGRHAAEEGVRLEDLAEPVDLLELGEVELGDRIAPPGPVGDEPFPGERAERLPERNQADARPLGPRFLVHALARAELAVEDRCAQRRGGPILGRRRPHRAHDGHGPTGRRECRSARRRRRACAPRGFPRR